MAKNPRNPMSDAELKAALDKCIVVTPDELTREETNTPVRYASDVPLGPVKDEVDKQFTEKRAQENG